MAKRRLGRGLDGLLPTTPARKKEAAPEPTRQSGGSEARIEELHPNRHQPRTRFDDKALDELAASIREIGVLEPILVRKRDEGGFEIVAGERRWRAAQRAGLKEVPVVVRELSSEAAFEAALVENLQREDLNPIETARALARLVNEHGHSQEEVARRIGKDRSTVANALRLLKLPDTLLDEIEEGRLSEGHGRALLGAAGASDILRLGREAVRKSWSVRETERQVRQLAGNAKTGSSAGGNRTKNANIRDLESRLSQSLGARVEIEDQKGKGRLTIRYASLDELDRILAKLLSS